jgi:hypothetical protein
MTTASTKTSAAKFVEFFAAGWLIGAHDPEAFFRHFGPRMHPNTVLIQPVAPPARGPGALQELFGPMFKAIPDLVGAVVRREGRSEQPDLQHIRGERVEVAHPRTPRQGEAAPRHHTDDRGDGLLMGQERPGA